MRPDSLFQLFEAGSPPLAVLALQAAQRGPSPSPSPQPSPSPSPGMMHTSAGYLLWASFTHHYTFDYHEGDVYACVADIGWITGAPVQTCLTWQLMAPNLPFACVG